MNPTTLSPNLFRTNSDTWSSKTTPLMLLLRLSLIGWLAKRSLFITLAQWCTNFLNIKVTPQQVVAFFHTEIAFLTAVFVTNMPPIFHWLAGIWVVYAVWPLLPLCRQLMRD